MAENEPGARSGLGTIRNANRLLDLLARGPRFHHLTELAQESGMSVPTVHRLLRSLALADLVVQDPSTARYGLGPALTRLSNHFVARHPVTTAFSPFAVALRDQLSATVSIHILVADEAVCLDQIDADDRGAFRSTGTTTPAHSTAPGRVLLAHAATSDGNAEDLPGENELALWRDADYVHVPGRDLVTPSQVAVPIRAVSGTVVAALCADVDRGADEARISAVGAVLVRTAITCGRGITNG